MLQEKLRGKQYDVESNKGNALVQKLEVSGSKQIKVRYFKITLQESSIINKKTIEYISLTILGDSNYYVDNKMNIGEENA